MEPAGTKSTRRAHRTNPVSQYGVLAGLRVKLENGLLGTMEGTDLWASTKPLHDIRFHEYAGPGAAGWRTGKKLVLAIGSARPNRSRPDGPVVTPWSQGFHACAGPAPPGGEPALVAPNTRPALPQSTRRFAQVPVETELRDPPTPPDLHGAPRRPAFLERSHRFLIRTGHWT